MILHDPTRRCVLAAAALAFSSAQAAPEFSSVDGNEVQTDSPISNDQGKFALAWSASGETATYSLERSLESSFAEPVTLYEGPATDAFVSGLPAGTNYFRVAVAEAPDEFSAPLIIQVDYPSSARVAGLFALGAALFVATLGTIITGHLKTRNDTFDS